MTIVICHTELYLPEHILIRLGSVRLRFHAQIGFDVGRRGDQPIFHFLYSCGGFLMRSIQHGGEVVQRAALVIFRAAFGFIARFRCPNKQ